MNEAAIILPKKIRGKRNKKGADKSQHNSSGKVKRILKTRKKSEE
jgi:hypothetical protein